MSLRERPNLLLIITDQERPPMHWPEGLAEATMPTRERMLRHGINFKNATCNSAMCSPSRSTFISGLMPARHRVVDTLTDDGPFSFTETQLSPELPNFGKMLKAAGYDVHWRGKWHVTKGADGTCQPQPADLEAFGFDGWIAPDAGHDTRSQNFGGGRADYDAAYIEQAVEFLSQRAASPGESPFCLVVSLVNPHDVLGFPNDWSDDYDATALEGSVQLPETFNEDLRANLKPTAHAAMAPAIDMAVGALATDRDRLKYLNFYANLTAQIDRQTGVLLDLLYDEAGEPTQLGRDTVVVRFADHGELGLAHGGLRQKAFNVYEETLRVPLIVSNPELFPEARETEHPASLVDLVPTLAALAGTEPPEEHFGTDLSPLLHDPAAGPVQDHVMFTFDDMHAGTGLVKEILPASGRIRCIRESRFKFARYFHHDGSFPVEYEMYDLQEDPLELHNLAHPRHPRFNEPTVASERERLRLKLAAAERDLSVI
ncbi:MAG: sulfatase-like hydrolase/transferase [Solirubrobacterales bacterium]